LRRTAADLKSIRGERGPKGGREAKLAAALELEQGSLLAAATPTTHRSAKHRKRWGRERRVRT
jgi:hypothetical protein